MQIRKLSPALVAALLLLFAVAALATPPSVVEIAVADEAKSRAATDIVPLIENLLIGAVTGDTVNVFNASSLTRVASITISDKIPTNVAAQVKMKWLQKIFPAEIRKISEFFKAPARPDTAGGNVNVVRYISGLGLLAVEFPGSSIHAVYFGSPIVTAYPYSLTNGYPSDSFLLADNSNLYSIVGKANALRGVELHMIHSPNLAEFSAIDSTIHHDKLKRFYSLLLDQQSATLASFVGTIDHLKQIKTTKYPPISYGKPELGDGKLRMIEITTAEMRKEESALQKALWAIPNINVNPPPPNNPTGAIELAIKWTNSSRSVDMDIYTQVGDDIELSYKSTRSKTYDGRHLKDIVQSEQFGKEEFETVVYNGKVPVNTLKVFVNHYSGQTTVPVELEFRVRFENRIYAKRYRIAPGQGTHGGGNRNTSPSWVRISLQDVMGLK